MNQGRGAVTRGIRPPGESVFTAALALEPSVTGPSPIQLWHWPPGSLSASSRDERTCAMTVTDLDWLSLTTDSDYSWWVTSLLLMTLPPALFRGCSRCLQTHRCPFHLILSENNCKCFYSMYTKKNPQFCDLIFSREAMVVPSIEFICCLNL